MTIPIRITRSVRITTTHKLFFIVFFSMVFFSTVEANATLTLQCREELWSQS